MTEPMDPHAAQKTVRDCVCSDCWEPLAEYYDPHTRQSTVRCATPDCPHNGYVSKTFVERRKAENRGETIEAKRVLKDALPWLPQRSQKSILSDLGF